MSNEKKDLSKGDKVTWRSHGQTVEGTVEQKITKRTEAAGREVAASPEEPQYRVTSDKTGKDAVHKPGSLHRRG
ncbi:DUF2945 domain-containing protein [Actinoplanes sp. CA-030573]|uniref:DUF2945 domain-containing protein n=1 Tax=Actinoplanes sp. CA-030573 TaxID=3239898 RepID=UPI003D9051D9